MDKLDLKASVTQLRAQSIKKRSADGRMVLFVELEQLLMMPFTLISVKRFTALLARESKKNERSLNPSKNN